MDLQSERLKILKKVEAGEFTLDEADSLLRDLDAAARQSDGTTSKPPPTNCFCTANSSGTWRKGDGWNSSSA